MPFDWQRLSVAAPGDSCVGTATIATRCRTQRGVSDELPTGNGADRGCRMGTSRTPGTSSRTASLMPHQTANAVTNRDLPMGLPLSDRGQFVTGVLVQLTIVLAGLGTTVANGATMALVIVVMTFPVWVRKISVYPLAHLILAGGAAAAVAGVVLAEFTKIDHVVNGQLQREAIAVLFSGLAIMVIVLWGRLLFPLHRVVGLFGVGALADAFMSPDPSFKFIFAVPVTILVVGVLDHSSKKWLPIAAIVMLGFIGILDEARSFFAFCILAAALSVWQLRPSTGRRANRWFPVILLTGVGIALYSLVASLLTKGFFGPVLAQRSIAQIDATGSLIAGGRPEWSATWALMQSRPTGFGAGVVPRFEDVMVAKAGLASIGVDTGGYLYNYMFGGKFRLHSVISDLWVSFGLIGLVLAAIVVFALVRSLSYRIAEHDASTLTIFMSLLALWFMAFGPFFSNWRDVCFALGLVLITKSWSDQRSATTAAEGSQR